jgi:hypothetical protein
MSDEINDFQEQLDEVLAELDTLLHTTLPKISPQTARQARLEVCRVSLKS